MSNLTAPTINLAIFKGETVILPFQLVVAGTTTPVDINGFTLELTVRRKATDTVVVLQAAATITDHVNGLYQFQFSHAQTVAVAAGVYAYDVQRTDSGSETVLAVGSFTITQEVLYP